VQPEYATALRELSDLREQLDRKSALIESLKAEVIRSRRWRFGSSSEAIDPSIAPQLPLMGGASTAPAPLESSSQDHSDPPPRLMSVDAPRERRVNRRALRALPDELPRVIRVHEPVSCQCPDCGVPMRRLGEDASEQIDYVPGYFQVIRHVRPKLACSACARIVQAGAPMRLLERGLPTATLLAQVISAKYADHFPLYRQEGIYRRSGIELPRAMLARWVGETAKLLDPLVTALERYVLAATKLHADDTPVPVLSPGHGRTRTARLWAYVRDDRPSCGTDPPAVVYRYSPDRKAQWPRLHLSSFAGTLQADGYSGFASLYESGRVQEAACWAHARRKYFDVYVSDRSPTAAEALKRIGLRYAIERQIRGQTPPLRAQARRVQSAPIVAELRTWLRQCQRSLSAKSPLANAIQYTLTRWTALTRYVDDGAIEIDNNAAERAIRALVLGRRNYLFAGSDAGGETAARLYSLIGTCRLNGLDPHSYLRHVIERIASHPITRIQELLPWRVGVLPPHRALSHAA